MILHNWGEIEYLKARKKMQDIHEKAQKDGQNHLILCSHPAVYTVGVDEKNSFNVPIIKTDRGGSITCHSKGQNIYYFCFQISNPAKFYKRVLEAFEEVFKNNLPSVKYDRKNPGFYIENKKIASLGFRYSKGVSLHGVALNVDVDLDLHSKVNPCNLPNILPTSLKNEGVTLSQEEVDKKIVQLIKKSFNDAV